MRLSHVRTTGRAVFAGLASVAVLVAYAGISSGAASASAATAAVEATQYKKAKGLQFARVDSQGVLVSGTATSAERFGTGSYFIRFDAPIGECGAAANSAAFAGFDSSVLRIMAQISIGFGLGGGPDDHSVHVSLFDHTGASDDSAFSLVLICP
jgi:hypothetical protein